MCGTVDFKPFKCEEKRKNCLVCSSKKHPRFQKPNCDQRGVVYHIVCNICSEEYIGQTERPIHIRFQEHHKKLTASELNKHKHPKKNDRGQTIIDDHMPSAVSAHAMLHHNGKYDFSIGQLSVKHQQDARVAYEALACKMCDPKLNRRAEGGDIIPF